MSSNRLICDDNRYHTMSILQNIESIMKCQYFQNLLSDHEALEHNEAGGI